TGKEPRFIVKTAHSSNASKLVDKNIGIAIFPASVAKNISADSNVVVRTLLLPSTSTTSSRGIRKRSRAPLLRSS
ncbi:MAG: hypothetical protein K6F03_10260, partial [Saccharofermentans sp.]|nr:hypothetical protein [Saccharofermentans sp.]